MLHTLLVTDFSIAAVALSASGKVPRYLSFALNASTPCGPRLIRNPVSPFMTETRRDGSAVSFGMSVPPKEKAPPEGDAVLITTPVPSSVRGDAAVPGAVESDPRPPTQCGCWE